MKHGVQAVLLLPARRTDTIACQRDARVESVRFWCWEHDGSFRIRVRPHIRLCETGSRIPTQSLHQRSCEQYRSLTCCGLFGSISQTTFAAASIDQKTFALIESNRFRFGCTVFSVRARRRVTHAPAYRRMSTMGETVDFSPATGDGIQTFGGLAPD